MTIRENLEQWEKDYLSPYASLSVNSKGRLRPEEQCDIRPVFQRDRDRIIHCKAFRRLKDKTQVFPLDQSDFVRTRADPFFGGFFLCQVAWSEYWRVYSCLWEGSGIYATDERGYL